MKETKETTPGTSLNAENPHIAPAGTLGDFTTTWRVLPISGLALVIGVLSAYVAVVLLKLISFFTNVFFFHRLSTAPASPGDTHLGLWVILVPVIGGLIVGLMAKFGSDKIRGHGIPEAIEAILLRGAKVEPRLAVLKPVSTAISIGSGGPFGAEGPIIMTGGAFGSLIAQFFHLTSAERKTLLVAGAAAGMSATFAAPFASIMLAIELLLFEWKPRSFIPVALASITAAAARVHLLGGGPIFPVPAHDVVWAPAVLFGCLLAGLLSGCLSALLTQLVYAFEDAFLHLKRIHWMWWPAIGGLGIGIGGYFYPRALGVGYDVIQQVLQGNATLKLILGVLIVKMPHLEFFPGLRNIRRRSGSIAHDGRRSGCRRCALSAASGGGVLAADQHGRHACRYNAIASNGRDFRFRAYRRLSLHTASADRLRYRAFLYRIDHGAVHPYGKDQPSRPSSFPRVRG